MEPRTLALLILFALAALSSPAIDIVTRPASGSVSASGNSFHPVWSGDGSKLVFQSHANNLVTNDNRREWLDLFTHDLLGSNTVLVSVSLSGGGGNGNSSSATVSANGQWVAFASDASDLVVADTNQSSDIFVRDVVAGTTRLVSADLVGQAPTDNAPYLKAPLSGNPMISQDGRWVFFESRATTLAALPDTNNSVDVFARDLHSDVTLLVSRNFSLAGSGLGMSELADITPDGARVVFLSNAGDLVPGATNLLNDVYVWDRASNAVRWVSAALDYPDGYRCASAALSDNGRYAAFVVVPSSGAPAVYRCDLASNVTVFVSTNVHSRIAPQISSDGRFILFETGTNIFRWDAETGNSELVDRSVEGFPATNGISHCARMSPDGNGIAFVSDATGLTTNGVNNLSQVYARNMASGFTQMLTTAPDGLPGLGSEQSLVSVAPDFSWVAFDSRDSGLTPGDNNHSSDVFVRDLSGGETRLISSRSPSTPRTSGAGHVWLEPDSVSADGRFIAFTSHDSDFVTGDTNGWSDVFVHDTLSGATVSPGFLNGPASYPMISANGRYVVYSRVSEPGIIPFTYQTGVFRLDRESGANEPVSTNGVNYGAAINADGSLVAFRSGGVLLVRNMLYGTNLVIGSGETFQFDGGRMVDARFTPDGRFVLFKSTQVKAYDLLSNRTQVVSASFPVGGTLAVSGNSRYVAVSSYSTSMMHDLINETNVPGYYNYEGAGNATISADGRFVALYEDYNPAFSLLHQIVVEDRQTRTLEVLTPPGRTRLWPVISGDGRFVVFGTEANTFVPNHNTRSWDVFVHDRRLGTTTLLSRSALGTPGNTSSSSRPVLAADGRTVVFHSMASDLVSGDYNDKRDIFVVKLHGEDTDNDGMDDDWEIVYFGSRVRDGQADFDNDGASDLAEFLAGTDPTNTGSVFQVLTVTSLGGSGTRVLWSGNPERSYRVEFKDGVAAATWSALSGPISWTGDSASLADTNAVVAHRFYRVVRLP